MSLSETSLSIDESGSNQAARHLRLRQTAGYCIAFIVLGLTSASLGPTLPGLASHLGVTLSQASYLFTFRSLGYLLGSFFSGRLYDRFPSHPVMVGILCSMAIAMLLAPVMPLLWLMVVVLMLVGICEGFMDVGGNTILVWVHKESSGPYMNALHFFFGLGAFISPIIIAQAIVLSGDVKYAYWVLAVLILPAVFYLLRQPSPLPVLQVTSDSAQYKANLLLVGVICFFFFLYVSGEASMGGWVYTYTLAQGLGDKISAAYLTSGFWGALTAGRLLSVPLATRMKTRTLLLIDLTGALITLTVILTFPHSSAALWIGALGTGLAMASIFPTMLSFAGQHLAITGQVTGWFLVGASLGGMVTPWIIGQLFTSVGPSVAIIAIEANILLAFILYWVIMVLVGRSAYS